MTAPEPEARPRQLIYLSDSEMSILMREANGPINGRVVQCSFGPGRVWLDPASRDSGGNYPRWIVFRLAILRGSGLRIEEPTGKERTELIRFAAEHTGLVLWPNPDSLVVCRWALDCRLPAAVVIAHTTVGEVPACTEHATEHAQWVASRAVNRGPEPDPECWCPDANRANNIPVPYCPAHGTPDERGLEDLP